MIAVTVTRWKEAEAMQVTLSEEDARLIAKYVADELIARQPVQMATTKELRARRLNIGEAAAYMNISRETINRWRKNKPEFKVLEHIDGISTYFLANELDEYLNQ